MGELLSLLRVIDTDETDRENNLQRLTHLLASDTEAQEKFFLHDGSSKIINLLTSKNWNVINQTLCALSYAASNHNGCKTALTSKKVFNTLFCILHNIQCDNFITAIYAMFFMSSIMSGNSEAQSIVRQTGCLQYLNNIFSKLGKSVIKFSDENIFHLLKKTWSTLCSSLVMAMNNPQNYENQAMIGFIMPEALKILSYLLHNILEKRNFFKNFEYLLLDLIPVIIFMMLNNPENQLKFSLYHGLQTVVNALFKLDKLFYIVPNSEILVKKFLKVLCVSVNENRDNCYQAGMLGILSVLINLLFKVKDGMSVLLALSQLLFNCNENIKIFIKDGGILILPTAMKKMHLPSDGINIVKFLQKLCDEHIYGNNSVNNCNHKSSSANQNDEDSRLSSSSSVLEVDDDHKKNVVINDVYSDQLKTLPSNPSSGTSNVVKNTSNKKYENTNEFNSKKKYHYASCDVLSDENDDLSNLEVPLNNTPSSFFKKNKFQRSIEMSLSSNLPLETSTLTRNENNRKYKSINRVNRPKKQHYPHSDVLFNSNDNTASLEYPSNLKVPINTTPVSFERINVNEFIGGSELFSKSAKSHISETNTSLILFKERSSVENGVLFKTLLPPNDPGVISSLYLKTMVDKAAADNDDPNFKSPLSTKHNIENKNTFSNQFCQTIDNVCRNILTNNKPEIISKPCCNVFNQETKSTPLNKTDLKRKSDINLFFKKMSDMEHYTSSSGEACAENLEYSYNNCDQEEKNCVLSNEPLISDAKDLRHFFSSKSKKALMTVLHAEKMGLNKDKMLCNKVLHHQCHLKSHSKPSENTSKLRKKFYRILMEKADKSFQIQKEGKEDPSSAPFSEEELKNLVSGVSKFGLDFKTIRRAYVFHEKRTSKELYLKWKTCFMATGNDT